MFSRPFWLLILLLLLTLSLAQTPKTTPAQPNYLTQDQLEKELSRQKEIQDLKLQNLETKLSQQVDNTKEQVETRQKNLDFWAMWVTIFIAALTLIVAIVAIAVPYTTAQNLKDQLKLDKREIEEYKKAVLNDVEQSKQDRTTSTRQLEEIRTLKTEIESIVKEAKADHGIIRNIRSKSEDLEQNLPPNKIATLEQKTSIEELKQAPDPLVRLSALALEAEQKQDWKTALTYWTIFTDLDTTNHRAWFGAGFSIGQLAITSQDVEEKKKLLRQAITKYAESIKNRPDYSDAWNNLGATLFTLADIDSDPDEKSKLLLDAIRKYKEAIALKSNSYASLFNWGVALFNLANLNSNPNEKMKLLLDAIAKYEEVVQHEPNNHLAWNNSGTSLTQIAALKEDSEEKKELFTKAIVKYQEATKYKPDYAHAWYNWGVLLFDLANLNSNPDEKKKLLLDAITKYQEVVKHEPNEHLAWNSLISTYLKLFHLDILNRSIYLDLALEAGIKTESLVPGLSAYDLACVYALSGNETEARNWLQKSKEHGNLPSCDHLKSDIDLDSVRETEWFKELLAEQCKE